MACNNQSTDCAPCRDCQEPVPPVLPRCQNIVLPMGVYTNATITVNEEGCIADVQSGTPFAYQPDNCCTGGGGGGGGEDGLPGPPGPPGAGATVNVGTVNTTAPGTPATVTNVGTPTNAILNFTIPRGAPGADGDTGTGLTLAVGSWEFDNGLVQSVPADFPPINTLMAGPTGVVGVTLAVSKDPTTGMTTITLNMEDYATAVNTALNDLNNLITALTTRVTTLESTIATCCP